MVGGAILALRPSVRAGGYVGTIDLLVVDPAHDVDRLTEALLEELLRSARNKGCTVVEAAQPDDPDAQARWERMGFAPPGRASTNRDRGGRRESNLMNIPAEQRERAGRTTR